jgi:putative hydrolase of the HAD superfamily
MIKCIIFDWGMLFTTSDYDNMVEVFGLSKKKIWELEDKYSDKKDCSGFWKDIKNLGVDKTEKEISDIFNIDKILELNEMSDLLDKLSNYTLVLLSNQVSERTKILRKKYPGVMAKFRHVFFSDEIGLMKPDVKSFQFIIDKSGFNPEECLFVDDTKRHIESAKSLGIYGILFKSADQLKEELSKLSITF